MGNDPLVSVSSWQLDFYGKINGISYVERSVNISEQDIRLAMTLPVMLGPPFWVQFGGLLILAWLLCRGKLWTVVIILSVFGLAKVVNGGVALIREPSSFSIVSHIDLGERVLMTGRGLAVEFGAINIAVGVLCLAGAAWLVLVRRAPRESAPFGRRLGMFVVCLAASTAIAYLISLTLGELSLFGYATNFHPPL